MRTYSRRLDFLELNPYVFFFFHESYFYCFHVKGCSGMFRVPGFIDAPAFLRLLSSRYGDTAFLDRTLITSSQLVLVPSLAERTRKVDWR